MPCKRSSAVPIPFGVGFQFLGHAVSLRQLRHDQLHAISCRFVNLSARLSYVHPAIAGGFLFGAGSGTRSAILGAVSPPARGTQKVFTGYFLPFGTFPSSPAYLLSTSKKSPWLNTNSVSGAADETKFEQEVLASLTCPSMDFTRWSSEE